MCDRQFSTLCKKRPNIRVNIRSLFKTPGRDLTSMRRWREYKRGDRTIKSNSLTIQDCFKDLMAKLLKSQQRRSKRGEKNSTASQYVYIGPAMSSIFIILS